MDNRRTAGAITWRNTIHKTQYVIKQKLFINTNETSKIEILYGLVYNKF